MNKKLEQIVHKMLYTCEEATLLIEKKASNQRIGMMDNIRLKGHLAMCKFCRAYNKKVTIIDKIMLHISKKESDNIQESEMNDFKQQLKDKTL